MTQTLFYTVPRHVRFKNNTILFKLDNNLNANLDHNHDHKDKIGIIGELYKRFSSPQETQYKSRLKNPKIKSVFKLNHEMNRKAF